jgi:hypothetical protein
MYIYIDRNTNIGNFTIFNGGKNNYYYKKFLKYKLKYLNLKKNN